MSLFRKEAKEVIEDPADVRRSSKVGRQLTQEETRGKFETMAEIPWGDLRLTAGVAAAVKKFNLERVLDEMDQLNLLHKDIDVKIPQVWKVRGSDLKANNVMLIECFYLRENGERDIQYSRRVISRGMDCDQVPEFMVLGGAVVFTAEEYRRL